MKTDDIRRSFLEFFRAKGHEVVASDSLVPTDDPTLLFTGAGMNQFKDRFLGRGVTYKRAASSQKCIRTGDLNNVGKTSGHHTFFEMLGNFSFGDYFKAEAISWAWEFFTVTLSIPRDRLWVSVYKLDQEAYDIWKGSIGVAPDRIVKLGEKDNFWPSEAPSKGPNGPCGPCSEIYYDYGADTGCRKSGCNPECGCGRFVEVWNLVFTQFDRQSDGSLKGLPNRNIDTGMGLERIASVMQGVKTNFEIDIFRPIVGAIETCCDRSAKPPRSKVNAIADHIRAVTFCIADGVMPSNEERGYVVRKLIRRGALHGQDIGIREPFQYKLVAAIADVMGSAYPEVAARRDDIAQVVKKEEEAFLVVIASQLPKVDEAFERIKQSGAGDAGRIASTAFSFYDTYGMPYEMLEEIAEKHQLKIDRGAFEELLDRQREMSRSKSKLKGEIFSETFAKKVEALGLKTEFLGYETILSDARVAAVLGEGEVVLDRTPFYGESGGQTGDRGRIETPSGIMEVEDAKKFGQTIVHVGRILKGSIAEGEPAKAAVDGRSRQMVMSNHTAAHLLQAALRKVLGDHVRQTGSLVDSDHLRFDFTHMKKMEERELARVEELVNENIRSAIRVGKDVMDIDEARKLGAMALFGEKYDKTVRVVSVGEFSKELCGGTHVDNTKDIGLFRITSESSIASGVRRIEALTGDAAARWLDQREKARTEKLKLEAEKEQLKKEALKRLDEEIAKIGQFAARARKAGDAAVIVEDIEGISVEGLRALADKIRSGRALTVALLSAKGDDKVSFTVCVTDDLVKKGLSARELAKDVAQSIDGSGGGKDGFAQGGGKAAERMPAAFDRAVEAVKEKLK